MSFSKESIPDWAVGVFWMGVAALFLGLVSLFFGPNTSRFSAEATGTVTRVEKHRKTYVSYVRFEDSDHIEVEAKSEVNGPTRRHHEGDEVTVRYDPRDPGAGCLIAGDEDLVGIWGAMRFLVPIGGAALLVSAGAALYCGVIKPRRAG